MPLLPQLRPRRVAALLIATAVCLLGLLSSLVAPTGASVGLHATLQPIALPGASGSEPVGLQAGANGSVWVVGRHLVWHVSSTGHVLRGVPLPASSASTRRDTATATPDGGVSFLVVTELLGEQGSMLDHISPAGLLSSVALPSLSATDATSSPMAVGTSGLWSAWWGESPGGPPTGGMVSLDSTSGATSSYTTPLAPFTINDGPGGDFWLGGITTTLPERHSISLVTPTGATVKTINLPGVVGHDNDILSAPAIGLGMWLAVSGSAFHVSGSGALTAYRLPGGHCAAPYGVASAPDGTGWLLAAACGRGLQLVRLSRGQVMSTSLRINASFGIAPALATFASGKLWVIGSSASGLTALYAVGVR